MPVSCPGPYPVQFLWFHTIPQGRIGCRRLGSPLQAVSALADRGAGAGRPTLPRGVRDTP
eukprot:4010141-Heterocapsa_arctica.AAC.1